MADIGSPRPTLIIMLKYGRPRGTVLNHSPTALSSITVENPSPLAASPRSDSGSLDGYMHREGSSDQLRLPFEEEMGDVEMTDGASVETHGDMADDDLRRMFHQIDQSLKEKHRALQVKDQALNSARIANARLNARLARQESVYKETEQALRQRIADLENQNNKTSEQRDRMRDERDGALVSVNELQTENHQLKTDMATSATVRSQLLDSLTNIQDRFRKGEQIQTDLDKQVAYWQKACINGVKAAKKKLRKTRAQLQEAGQEIARLQTENNKSIGLEQTVQSLRQELALSQDMLAILQAVDNNQFSINGFKEYVLNNSGKTVIISVIGPEDMIIPPIQFQPEVVEIEESEELYRVDADLLPQGGHRFL